MEKVKVGVIFGGRSVEHEVSIISALQAIRALDKEKYQAVPIYISKNGTWLGGDALLDLALYQKAGELEKKCYPVVLSPVHGRFRLDIPAEKGLFKKAEEVRLDVVLPVVHGSFVEDGCLQGLLELTGIPYVGPGVLGAACGMDKIAMKAILIEAGLPVADYLWFYTGEWEDDNAAIIAKIENKLAYPVIVKPADLGSSIGIKKAANQQELQDALDLAASFSRRLIVERVIEPLREINCSVLGFENELELSLCEEPFSADEILSFKDKYIGSGNIAKGMSAAKRRVPADISDQVRTNVEDYARRSFHALDGAGVCRIDFLLNSNTDEVFVNEVNTIPGSLAYYLWEPAGKSYPALLEDLIKIALLRSRRKEKNIYSYSSNILAQGGFKGKK